MKKCMKVSFYFFIPVFFVNQTFSQEDSTSISIEEQQTIFAEAEFYFEEGNYTRAIPLYAGLADDYPSEMMYKYKLGICYIYKTDEKEKAISYLEEVYQSAPQTKDLFFYLGVAYHLNYKFDEALKFFNDFLSTNPPVSKRVLTNKYIENCKNGKILIQSGDKKDIKNLSPVINTKFSEYVPLLSSDESVLIYTYRGNRSKGGLMDRRLKPSAGGDYYEDIFISQKAGNDWQLPKSIGDNINDIGHDACIALSADGQKLFIYKSTSKDKGDIYISQLNGEIWSKPEKLGPTVNTKHWEGSVSMSSDEQTLYFASERPDGLGKRDIWICKKLEDGQWGNAINIGTAINTPLNEDAPFIHPDGVTLFFSSEGHGSMGGYDIMYSTFENGVWSTPKNLEYPVNTTEDDRFYVLSADGERGYFSSDRKGGRGQQDIYVVSPGIQGEKPVLALVVGIASANDTIVDATINVYNQETGKKIGSYKANSNSGKYLIAFSPGNKYKIIVEHKNMEPHVEYIDLKSLDTYVQAKQDFKIYSSVYKMAHNIHEDSVSNSNSLQVKISLQIENLKKTGKDTIPLTSATPPDAENKIKTDSTTVVLSETKKDTILIDSTVIVSDVQPVIENKISEETIVPIASENEVKADSTTFILGETKKDTVLNPFIQPVVEKTVIKKETVDTTNKLVEKSVNLKIDSSAVAKKIVIVDTIIAIVPASIPVQPPLVTMQPVSPCHPDSGIDFSFFVGQDLNNIAIYNQLIARAGNICVEGLIYKVQIGAYRHPENFKYPQLVEYGSADIKDYPDGITRFTMKEFKTLKEAEGFRQQVIDKGIKDAWITTFMSGERRLLQDIIAVNFYTDSQYVMIQ